MAETMVYFVKIVERAHSSGEEHWFEKTFASLEGASKYLKQYIVDISLDYNYPEDWDVKDMGCEFPGPEIFSLENLIVFLNDDEKNKWKDTALWGPESDYEAQRPCEIFLKMITMSA